MTDVEEVKHLLKSLNPAQQREVLTYLREIVPQHEIEKQLMASAETLLNALARSPELTRRMIRGVIAEAAFATDVIPTLRDWTEKSVERDQPYDFMLTDDAQSAVKPGHAPESDVRVQVKMQRSRRGMPLLASEVWTRRVRWPAGHYVVEVQRTRTGQRSGVRTRPYRFGEFDILAVSMGPATGRWADFMYTLERWLLPKPDKSEEVLTFQPVAPESNEYWTSDFVQCVRWLRSGETKRLGWDMSRSR